MVRLVLGIAIGYLLGAKAGRERYEQILRVTSKVVDDPAVQGVAGFVQAKVSRVLPHSNRREPRRPDWTVSSLVDRQLILPGSADRRNGYGIDTTSVHR